MRNESQERGPSEADRDARGRDIVYGPNGEPVEERSAAAMPTPGDPGVNDDVPGFSPESAGAATTTGQDFAPGSWTDPSATPSSAATQTSEPGPTAAADQRQAPEQTSGLDRPPDYRERDVASSPAEPAVDRSTVASEGETGVPFGDHRVGDPHEWSEHHEGWPNRPVQQEDVTSGHDAAAGAGMGAGMYWSGESAREDDEMRGEVPDGEQIPSRGTLADETFRPSDRSADATDDLTGTARDPDGGRTLL